MTRRAKPLAIVPFLLGMLVLGLPAAGAAEPVRSNGWIMNDLAAAQAEARDTGKPIFVVFRCEA